MFSQKYTLMGVLNATPDSFSGDGVSLYVEKIKEKIDYLLKSGCHIIDVGGESTRPGFVTVSSSEELDRVSCVLDMLKETDAKWISIDSTKPAVIEKSLLSGVQIVNDVNGFCDQEIVKLAQKFDAYCVVMHNARLPHYSMDESVLGNDLIKLMISQIKDTIHMMLKSGIAKDKIIIDPGLGFGKTFQQNWDIIKYCDRFNDLGYPVLYAASRKSFIGSLCDAEVDHRLGGSLGIVAHCFQKGIKMFRIHDAFETNQMLNVMSSLV